MADLETARMTDTELLAGIRELVRRVQRGDQLRPRLLDIADASRYLGVGDKAIRALIAKGELPYIQRIPGRSPYLLDIRDLDAWADRHKVRA